MPQKYRLIIFAVVALAIPMGIYILFPEDWKQTLPWIGLCVVIFGGYEIYCWRKK